MLGPWGQDRSGEAQNLALFGPVERQVLPLSQPARGEFRRLLAVQDGRNDNGREEGEAEKAEIPAKNLTGFNHRGHG